MCILFIEMLLMKDWSAYQQIRNFLKFLENEKAETFFHVY